MAYILNIETATPVCSVVLSKGGAIIAQQTSCENNVHSEKLTLFIEELMHDAGVDFQALNAISVSGGPGSYTGLRIGVSVAKGLCYSLNKPLIVVSTLQAIAQGMCTFLSLPDAFYCPMIDARRMEVYTALYDSLGNEIEPVSAKIIDSEFFQDILKSKKIIFAGTGMMKCKEVIVSENSIFLDDFQHSAAWMVPLSEQKWTQQEFADVAYFEPFYLKEFQAGKPNVKGLK